ncbi:hypothetical protein BH24ACI3_BH24ACI3_04840 [soil metagenome]
MTGTTAKIMLAIGVTALLTAVVLIGVFTGFLFLRDQAERGPSVSFPAEKQSSPAIC